METGLLADLGSPEALVQAVLALRRRGYRDLDAFTPYPVRGLEPALGIRRSPLGYLVFPLAFLGAAGGYYLQLWCNGIDYRLNVGGRPLHSAPAFIPITFEACVLTAGLSTLVLLLALCRLPRLYAPVADAAGFARATKDGFWVGVDARDLHYDEERTAEELRALGAVSVVRAEERAP